VDVGGKRLGPGIVWVDLDGPVEEPERFSYVFGCMRIVDGERLEVEVVGEGS
jgi:hypothetical protein